jgi:hypothetical protein
MLLLCCSEQMCELSLSQACLMSDILAGIATGATGSAMLTLPAAAAAAAVHYARHA